MAGNAIETRGLVKLYGEHAAVNGLDLCVPTGCAFGLLGPNGAGKSTTIQMLLGLIAPTRGHATVLGKDPKTKAHAIRADVGYVPERHFIYGWMSVDEVIGFTRSFYPTWDDELCDDLTRRYALDRNKKVNHLSRGMVTKLALLLALAHRPQLLILDEPTSGLDPLIREEFNTAVAELQSRDHATVLYSSHIISDIETVADTIGIIDDGHLLIARPRTELLRTTKRIEATLAHSSPIPISPPGAVWQRRDGDRWTMTVQEFSEETIRDWCARNGDIPYRVVDLGLEEIFKDFIKGQQDS